MTLEQMRTWLHAGDEWDECRVLNCEYEEGESQCSVAALTREGKEVSLWFVQHDDTYLGRREDAEYEAECNPPAAPVTNRDHLLLPSPVDPVFPLEHLKTVRLDEREYQIRESTGSGIAETDWTGTIRTLFALLRAGWTPDVLSEFSMDGMFLYRAKLEGDFDALPTGLELVLLPNDRQDQEVIPLDCVLSFEKDPPPQPLPLPDGQTGWIVRGDWFDVWKHLEETFAHPKIKAQFTPEQLEQRRRMVEAEFDEVCPRGMSMPVVYYEAPENVTLNFYAAQWLDSPIRRSGSSSCFGVTGLTSKDDTGPHGLPLRASLLFQMPCVPQDIPDLPLGLMAWHRSRPQPPIVLHCQP